MTMIEVIMFHEPANDTQNTADPVIVVWLIPYATETTTKPDRALRPA